MAQGGDYAVILPENNQIYDILQNQQNRADRLQMQEQARLKEEQARQGVLANTIGDAFNDKDYATGTQFDPVIRKRLADARAKFAAEIKANPGMSGADLQFRIQKEMGNLGAMAAGLKNYRTQIKEQAAGLAKQGIDGSVAEKLAMDRALYKMENGQKVLRNPEEVDFTKDYLQEVMQDSPELLVNRTAAFGDYLKSTRPYEVRDELSTENNGITKKWTSDLKLYPFQEIAMENGKPMLGKDGKPFVRTKGQQVDVNGTIVTIADDRTYQEAISNPTMRLAIEADYKETGNTFPPGSQEAEVIKRGLLYNRLNSQQPILNSFKSLQSESALKERQDAGLVTSAVTAGIREANRIAKENEKEEKKFSGSGVGNLTKAIANDPAIINNAEKLSDGSYDVTDFTDGFVVAKNGKEDVYAQRITINPATKKMVIEVEDEAPIVIQGEANIKKYLARKAALNKSNPEAVEKNFKVDPDADRKARLEERKNKIKFDINNPFSR